MRVYNQCIGRMAAKGCSDMIRILVGMGAKIPSYAARDILVNCDVETIKLLGLTPSHLGSVFIDVIHESLKNKNYESALYILDEFVRKHYSKYTMYSIEELVLKRCAEDQDIYSCELLLNHDVDPTYAIEHLSEYEDLNNEEVLALLNKYKPKPKIRKKRVKNNSTGD